MRFIVPVPVGLPPARALTGEVQSQDRQGLTWRAWQPMVHRLKLPGCVPAVDGQMAQMMTGRF